MGLNRAANSYKVDGLDSFNTQANTICFFLE